MRPHSFGLAALALFDDDEDLVMLQLLSQLAFKRKSAHEMILSREKEGAFNLLIKKYLMTNDDKFVEYFRVSLPMFHTILEHISNDITSTPCNRHPNPISPEQKLCVTLRLLV